MVAFVAALIFLLSASPMVSGQGNQGCKIPNRSLQQHQQRRALRIHPVQLQRFASYGKTFTVDTSKLEGSTASAATGASSSSELPLDGPLGGRRLIE